MDPSQYYRPNLLGGSVEYDVDLSQSNCGCVAAFYLVGAPGKNRNGVYWNTDGYYYCDANQVGGNYCPEYDIMEANMFVSQTTVHSCNAPDGKGFYSQCNRGGTCIQNTKDKVGYNDYGPGGQYKINTQKPFHFKVDFNKSGSNFGSFVVTMSQDGKSIQMTGGCGDNANMTNDLRNGMAFTISNWSTYDSWLWGNRCSA